MTQQNPIADAMSAIKNAGDTSKLKVTVEPASRLFGDMLKVMQEYGYITGFILFIFRHQSGDRGKGDKSLNGF